MTVIVNQPTLVLDKVVVRLHQPPACQTADIMSIGLGKQMFSCDQDNITPADNRQTRGRTVFATRSKFNANQIAVNGLVCVILLGLLRKPEVGVKSKQW